MSFVFLRDKNKATTKDIRKLRYDSITEAVFGKQAEINRKTSTGLLGFRTGIFFFY